MGDSNGAKVAEWMTAETLAEHLVPLLEHYDVKWRGHGLIYVDHEQYNIVTAQRILADLSACLGVSIELVRSRLIELGWLTDARSTLRVRDYVACVIDKQEPWSTYVPEVDDPEMDEEHEQA
jgi:hypothetical protein